ncbi:arabinofuranosyltransferase [Actinomycetospora sp. TBRC 11914]|uniref:arabinofuranosyltransferase n=1 Tax=Actinomycetospora sp. TBRC 11914 TaxID=2729387 RepID=UPI00145D4C67|nr:arabinofuranosyltransferase [Actinomycetospora sp. TBRC 11914]NMO90072.1 arabinofuranosyltransferase [Actinomycetospora sp. TBRC 11914]
MSTTGLRRTTIPAAPAVQALRRAPGWWTTVGGLLVALGCSLAAQVAISRLRIPFPTFAATAIAATLSAVVVAALVGIAASGRRAGAAAATLAVPGLLALLVTLWPGLLLQGTHYYLGGISIDQSFRTQALARYAATSALTDMNYLDLPSYYPAGWFWLGGRAAAVVGVPAWEFYKIWAILTLAVAAWAAFAAWRLVVSPARAVLVATATAIVGLGVSSAEPYAWLLIAPMPAVAVIAWGAIRADAHRRRGLALVATGVYLGVAAVTYSLHAGFFGVFVVLTALVPTLGRPARHVLPRIGRAAVVVVIGLLLALVVWAPFALAALGRGLPRSDAQRYLPYDGSVWTFPMLQPSSIGAMCLVGTLGIVLAWHSHARLSRPLAVLVLLVYAWFALTLPALLVGQTTLAFRLTPLVELVLVVAGVLTAAEAVLVAGARWRAVRWRALGGVLGVVVLAACAQGALSANDVAVQEAYSDPYPSTGAPAVGAFDPARVDSWAPQLVAAVDQLSGRPADATVVQGGPTQFYVEQPFHGFQQSTPHYANPLAQYEQRNAALRQWAGATDPADLLRRLDASPWPAPRAFLFGRGPDGTLTTTIVHDVFPRYPNVATETVAFPSRLFDSPAFARRDVGPWTVVVRR